MKLNILILEDNQDRIDEFMSRIYYSKHDINLVLTETASECIRYLKWVNFDIIFLDHDLGGEIEVNSADANTGSEVARFWESNKNKNKTSNIIIHSLNPTGTEFMYNTIKKVSKNVYKIPLIWTNNVWTHIFQNSL